MRWVALLIAITLAGCDHTSASRLGPSATPRSSPSPYPSSVKAPVPQGFVALSDVDETIVQDIRYATPHNFVGRPIDGYAAPRCLLTDAAAQALHRIQLAARQQGLSLKVYDCYRPLRAGADFLRWAALPDAAMRRSSFRS